MNAIERFTRDQSTALRCMESDPEGAIEEAALFYEGLNNPRATLRSLERRGLVRRVLYLDEELGYLYALACAVRRVEAES